RLVTHTTQADWMFTAFVYEVTAMPRTAAPDSPNRQLSIDEASELTGRSRQTILNYLTIGLPDRPEHGRLAGRQLPSMQVPGRSRTGYQYRIKLGDLQRAGLMEEPPEPAPRRKAEAAPAARRKAEPAAAPRRKAEPAAAPRGKAEPATIRQRGESERPARQRS